MVIKKTRTKGLDLSAADSRSCEFILRALIASESSSVEEEVESVVLISVYKKGTYSLYRPTYMHACFPLYTLITVPPPTLLHSPAASPSFLSRCLPTFSLHLAS